MTNSITYTRGGKANLVYKLFPKWLHSSEFLQQLGVISCEVFLSFSSCFFFFFFSLPSCMYRFASFTNDKWADLLTPCSSANPLLALKTYCQHLLKTCSEQLALKRVVFAADIIAYAITGVSLSDTHLNKSCKVIY